jgi:hypothetical protein
MIYSKETGKKERKSWVRCPQFPPIVAVTIRFRANWSNFKKTLISDSDSQQPRVSVKAMKMKMRRI